MTHKINQIMVALLNGSPLLPDEVTMLQVEIEWRLMEI